MAIRNEMIEFLLATAATASALGCDVDVAGADRQLGVLDDADVVFRGGDCNPLLTTCDYRNNFYMGLEEYGLDNLPLLPGSDPDATITEIVAYECSDPRGNPMFGHFHALAPSLSVDADGNFGPLTVQGVDFPWITCIVQGQQWQGTEWYITANAINSAGGLDTVDAKLRISQMFVLPGQSTLYYWQSDHEYLYNDPTYGWEHTCDEDPSPLLDFHAVVYRYLRIDEPTGVFGNDGDTMYLGCTSGLTAKSGYLWGYEPEPDSVHQVIANAGMAKYCGPAQDSFTETGTTIAVWNKTGSGPDQNPIDPVADPQWAPEAAWDASMAAMCIGKTRMDVFQPDLGEDFDCGGFTIPPCTPQVLDDPTVMFITYSQK